MMTQVNETRPDTAMEVAQANAEVMIAQLASVSRGYSQWSLCDRWLYLDSCTRRYEV